MRRATGVTEQFSTLGEFASFLHWLLALVVVLQAVRAPSRTSDFRVMTASLN